MTDLVTFLENEQIPSHLIWYYLRDSDGDKQPYGEKNNASLEEVTKKHKNAVYISNLENHPRLKNNTSFSEKKTLTLAHSLFLKHTDNLYCIDIDEPSITSMDELKAFEAKKNPDWYNLQYSLVFNCPYTKGNTKGIHIYIRINNVPHYTDQQGVFRDFTGDLIKKNNMWERIDKQVYSYNGKIPTVDFSDIDKIFNDKIKKPKIKPIIKKNVKIPEKIENTFASVSGNTNFEMDALPRNESLSNISAPSIEQEKYECDFEYALFVCIRDKKCSKGQYSEWIRIGQILKNELGNDGLDLFCEWSKLGDGKGLVDYTTFNHRKVCIKIYNALKQTKKKDNKPMLTKEHLKTIAKECSPEGYANRWGTETEEDLIDELTDVDIAKMFIEKYGNRFRCGVEGRGQTRKYYYFNDNCLWEATYDHVLKNMLSNEFYFYFPPPEVKLTEKCKKQVRKRLKTHTDKNHIAKEVTDLIFDAKFSKDVNNAEYLLPIKDKKIIDIRTNEVRDRTIEDKFDYECNATFLDNISKEQLDDIDKYFLELFCGNKDTKDLFISTVKSCMIGRPLRYFFIVTGSGRNGKSLLFKIFRNIFVKSFDTLSKETIIQQKYGSQITTHLEKTRQCRAGYISETKATDYINEEMVKGITGGDPLDHRAMYMSNETLIAICCLWLLTNNLPQFMVAKSMIDRVVVFPMDNEFPVNVKFEEEMKLKYDAIFTYIMMTGNLYDEIKLTPEMEKKKQEYIEENDRDYLKRFINEKTIEKKGSSIIKISAFTDKYKTYCYSKNIRNKEEHWDVKRYIKELTGKYGLKIKESHDALKNLKLQDLDWVDEDSEDNEDNEDDGCAEQK